MNLKFRPTEYKLVNVADGRVFEDKGWTLSDPEAEEPSLVRAVYATTKFTPRNLKGIYRYANWMPIKRTLKKSCAPVTYKSKGLAQHLGLNNLYITFSGWNPKIGAKMQTCSFKETEAFTICARMDEDEKRVLIVQSAGNTARAFAQVCSDNKIPVVICIPEDSQHDLWFHKKLNKCVKLIAVPHGCDYYDAIALGEKLAQDSKHYFLEGGAKNIARRDGMGTTILSCVEKMGRIPDAYFQAVGSGTGAIAAWENAERLAADGRFGENKMKVFVAQNKPFTLMHDSWKAGSRSLVPLTAEQGRRDAEVILAKVLSNRKPPYSIAGGLYDVLSKSNGDTFVCSNDDLIFWMLQFRNLEGYDLLPASCTAVAALAQAVQEGKVNADDYVMLNCTGGGTLASMSEGYVLKTPDLVLSPDLPADDIIKAVNALFR